MNKETNDNSEKTNRFAAENEQPQDLTPEELEQVLGGTGTMESDDVTISFVKQGRTYTTTFCVGTCTLEGLVHNESDQ